MLHTIAGAVLADNTDICKVHTLAMLLCACKGCWSIRKQLTGQGVWQGLPGERQTEIQDACGAGGLF